MSHSFHRQPITTYNTTHARIDGLMSGAEKNAHNWAKASSKSKHALKPELVVVFLPQYQ